MRKQNCFVIMAIGDQEFDGKPITKNELRQKYDDLIKEAILKALPGIEVVRADDISLPGTITTDIITRIMHSSIVVADVTYPNPNVFYELGLRHACRAGTIIIRDKNGPKAPFDISHLRHYEYENSPTGLKALAENIRQYYSHFKENPDRPDNHFLELAKLTNYEFLSYAKEEETPPEMEFISALMGSPAMLEILLRKSAGEEVSEAELLRTVLTNPEMAQPMFGAMVKAGAISLNNQPKKPAPSAKPRKRR